MALSNVLGVCTYVFVQSIGESFGRHIRALEAYMRDDRGVDLDRIEVHFEPRLPASVGRLVVTQSQYFEAYDKGASEGGASASEPLPNPSTRKSINIVVGTGNENPKKDPVFGFSISEMEKVMNPKIRATLAHELAHVALGHVLSDDGRLVGLPEPSPGQRTGLDTEQEADAARYSAFLVKLVSNYLRDRVHAVERSTIKDAISPHVEGIRAELDERAAAGQNVASDKAALQALEEDLAALLERGSWLATLRSRLGEEPTPLEAEVQFRENRTARKTEVWIMDSDAAEYRMHHSYEWDENETSDTTTDTVKRRMCMLKACGWLASMGPGAA